MARKNTPTKSLTSHQVIAIAGFGIGLVGFLAGLINRQFPLWLAAISLLMLFGCVMYLTRRWVMPVMKRLHPHVVNVAPWLAVILVILSGLILFYVSPSANLVAISLDSGKGAIFNSWQHQPHTKHIEATGVVDTLEWVITDAGRTGTFTFKVNSDVEPSAGASSGGYITFYGKPADRLRYRSIYFRCRATDVTGDPDLGVRLAVDNPNATGDRELISYEFGSLDELINLSDDWKDYEIPISSFRQIRYEPPFPENIDENTINKIVFFVDNDIAKQCGQATFSVSDIEFRQ